MLHVSHFKLSGHTRGLACGVCILHHTGLMTIGKQLLPSLVIPSTWGMLSEVFIVS
jgi:hypothetical protein